MSQFTIWWCRLGYPHLLEPKPVVQNGREIGDPRFSVNLHLAENDPIVSGVQQDILRVYNEKWPDPANRPYLSVDPNNPMTWFNQNSATGQRSQGLRVPLVWGPAENPDDPNAKGWILITAAKPTQHPVIVHTPPGAVAPVQITDPTMVYPGAEAKRAHVSIYAYTAGGVGIAAGINGVELSGREVGRFDSRPTMDQMFGGTDPNAPPPPPLPEGAPPQAPPAGATPEQVDPFS